MFLRDWNNCKGRGDLKKQTILIVDDDPDEVEALSNTLELEGYEVMTAMDGLAAVDKAKRSQPDLIIMDAEVPKVDGFEVCHHLKDDPRYFDIPILMLRAGSDDIYRASGLRCDVDASLTRPFELQELLELVERMMEWQAAAI